MAQEVFLRANAGIISADKFNDNISPFKPTRHAATAVFVREEQYLNPQTSPSLGSTVRFEVNKDGDYLDKVWLVVSMAALTKNASASFARYCDWLGYALIRQLRLIYGPTVLQRIGKEELFGWAQRWLSDEEYVQNARMVAGGLDGASRIAVATQPQYLKVPIHTLFLNQSETQSVCLQGLGNKLAFEIDFEPSLNLVQQDFAGAIAAPTNEQAFFASSQYGFDCRLGIEYVHVTTSERDAVVALYRSRKGLRYLINEVQRPPDQIISQTQTCAGTISYQVLNVSQPVYASLWLLRWVNDLTATYLTSPAINTVYGRNWFNCNGWLQPAGTSLPLRPMFSTLSLTFVCARSLALQQTWPLSRATTTSCTRPRSLTSSTTRASATLRTAPPRCAASPPSRTRTAPPPRTRAPARSTLASSTSRSSSGSSTPLRLCTAVALVSPWATGPRRTLAPPRTSRSRRCTTRTTTST